MRGLFVGRFQPFHLGHYRFVESIVTEVEEVLIGIGSAQASHTVENPFTAGERISMVHDAVADVPATTMAVPIEDIDRYAVWVAHVAAICPPFEVVYSNNPLVEHLFEREGYEVRGVELFDRERYRGTEIRRRMLDGEDWRRLVPDAVPPVVDEVDGVERLRRAAEHGSDE
ncbi:nicotinamide-nucleotide adenylyltransferase [Haloplanus sp. GCM10025708]|uniref:nicotinamide-nucleotide adenylyltransferase n=1 Tax=Haloferacaceae TaxID=1644056 RepID=UPI00360C8612